MKGFAATLTSEQIEGLKKYIPAGPIYTMDLDTRMFLATQERAKMMTLPARQSVMVEVDAMLADVRSLLAVD